jgi:hypothetical protein
VNAPSMMSNPSVLENQLERFDSNLLGPPASVGAPNSRTFTERRIPARAGSSQVRSMADP